MKREYLTGSQQMNDFIERFYPGSVEELHQLSDNITGTAKFVEVSTKSPKFTNTKSVTPVFVVPGFKPQTIKPLYEKLIFPAYEARLPDVVVSINDVANDLVNVSKTMHNIRARTFR